jgi:foldase protein PrsA
VKRAYYDDHNTAKEILLDEKMKTEYSGWLEEKKKEYDIENSLESMNRLRETI